MGIFKRKQIDMTSGSIFKKMIAYVIPLIIANLLQMAFNMADTFVLGIFADNGNVDVGAVSTTAPVVNMGLSLFIGLATGANVMVARYIGARQDERVKKVIGLSVFASLMAGTILAIAGIFGTRIFLTWLDVSSVHIEPATRYLTIYLCGTPFIMLYNFCANILRASGDTVRPMAYITIGGVINVVLNAILVIFTPFDVEGVAIATVACNAFAGIACFLTLLKSKTFVKFEWKYFRIYKDEIVEIVKIGIPSGINSCLFAFSSMLISSSINQLGVIFGDHIVTGSGYSNQFDNITYVCMNAVALASQAFVSQNLGAKNYQRVKQTLSVSLILVTITGIVVGAVMVALVKPIILAISGSELVANSALEKSLWIGALYVLNGIMDTMSFYLRGLGKSMTGMIVTLVGTVLFRAIWIWFIFPLNKTTAMLYCVFPITWVITIIIFVVILVVVLKNLRKQLEQDNLEKQIQPCASQN